MPIDRATVNTATVTGTDPGGGKPTDTGVAGAIPYNPSLEVVKTVVPGAARRRHLHVRGDEHRDVPLASAGDHR